MIVNLDPELDLFHFSKGSAECSGLGVNRIGNSGMGVNLHHFRDIFLFFSAGVFPLPCAVVLCERSSYLSFICSCWVLDVAISSPS